MAGTINKPKKPKSKRQPVRLRHKIEKAAAAKQRKQRKQARQNPEWRTKLKKDPGIPNLFPYKEKLLHQIEQTKLRKQEEARRRRELAKSGVVADAAEDGENDEDEDDMLEDGASDAGGGMDVEDADAEDDASNPMAALVASARAAARDYDSKYQERAGDDWDESDEDDGATGPDGHVIEVPGAATSRKAYDKVFKQVVEQADVVLYVLDARDPEGTRSRDVERAVLAAGAELGKRLILVLNKADLVPPAVLKGWLTHLRGSFPTLPLRASTPAPNAHTFHHRDLTVSSTSGALFRALKAYAASRNLKRAVSVGVIGYPNVGKSSVINALLARLGGKHSSGRGAHAACPAGAEAGVTTAIRSVKIDSKLTLLDSPGIVFPSSANTAGGIGPGAGAAKSVADVHANLILLNAVPPKFIEDPVPAITLLLRRLAASPERMEALLQLYNLPPLLADGGDPTTDFLVQVARKRGRLGRGGIPNIHAAAMTVITDWRDGRIQGWLAPPAPGLAAPAPVAAAPAGADAMSDEPAKPLSGAEAPIMADQKQIVTEWAKEFKLDGLWGDDESADAMAA